MASRQISTIFQAAVITAILVLTPESLEWIIKKGQLLTFTLMNSQERANILIGKILGVLPPEHEVFESEDGNRSRRAFENAQERLLLPEEVVHHRDRNHSNDDPLNLVACKDQKEHMLLHRKEDALRACGHKDWRRCSFCGEYDYPDNLYINKTGREVYHRKCRNKHRHDVVIRRR